MQGSLRSFLTAFSVLTASALCVQHYPSFFFLSGAEDEHSSLFSIPSSPAPPPKDLLPVFSVSAQPRIAVIGAGLGGSSFSYFARHTLPNAKVQVFDGLGRAGGRLNSFTVDSEKNIEIGGDALADLNSYGYRLGLDLGLKVRVEDPMAGQEGISAVFDGNSASEFAEPSLRDKIALGGSLKSFHWALKYNYWRRGTKPFESYEEFMSYGHLDQFSSSLFETFAKKLFSQEFIDNLIVPVLRNIYDQELEMSTFAGLTSITPMTNDAVFIENGNKRLAEASLEQSRAVVRLNTTVKSVKWNEKKAVYEVSFVVKRGDIDNANSEEVHKMEEFEHVILAAPIEFSGLLDDINKFSKEKIEARPYRHWHVTFIQAKGMRRDTLKIVQSEDGDQKKGGGDSKPIDNVFTKSGFKDFHKVGLVASQIGPKKKDRLYKIFSEEKISDEIVTKYFEQPDLKGVSRYMWPYTFPIQTPRTRFQPHIVHTHSMNNWKPSESESGSNSGKDGSHSPHRGNSFIYINGLESVATAMEISVIGARNAALFIGEQYSSTSSSSS
eukprot:Nk52_evm47s621 gene=Nk52_evmTU47s621